MLTSCPLQTDKVKPFSSSKQTHASRPCPPLLPCLSSFSHGSAACRIYPHAYSFFLVTPSWLLALQLPRRGVCSLPAVPGTVGQGHRGPLASKPKGGHNLSFCICYLLSSSLYISAGLSPRCSLRTAHVFDWCLFPDQTFFLNSPTADGYLHLALEERPCDSSRSEIPSYP